MMDLRERTVVVLGGSSGIGFATAAHARAERANVIVTARNAERLERAAVELGAKSAAFDATDSAALARFFGDLPLVDHVMVTAGRPRYGRLVDMDRADLRREVDEHVFLAIDVARLARDKVKPGGALLFMSGTAARHPGPQMGLVSTITAALPALVAQLALELAPIRVNVIAAGFVDTPLSAAIDGDTIEARRKQLRATLPIRRVVGPDDVAALAVHLMRNETLTGGTYDIDGGQKLVER